MVELSHWKYVVAPQRRLSASISTGFEWIIRYFGLETVELDSFQDDFDFGSLNSFSSVAKALKEQYPNLTVRVC